MSRLSDLFARTKRVHRPSWAEDEAQFMEVVLSPSVPRSEYQPRGACSLMRWQIADNDIIYGCESHPSLEAAVVSFVRLHLPRSGEMCVIIDDDHQWVLGWGQTQDWSHWSGCEAAFRVLERHYNQVDVAYWEADARDTIIGETADRVR